MLSSLSYLWAQPLIGFIAALGIGLLIGVERERNKGSGPTRGAAGVRTFALVALLGAIASAASITALIVMFGVAVTLLGTVSYWRSRDDDPGITTEVALLVTYALGVLALVHPKFAAALGVLVVLLLASRSSLHELAKRRLSDREVLDGILLAAAALIVLPLLPDQAIGPYDVVNPRLIWRITVMVLLINAAGYVAMRAFKSSRGLALAGFLGGFVSSAATIAAMAARSRGTPTLMRACAAGAALSSVATAIQLTLVLYLANPLLANSMLPALLAFGVVAVAYGALLAREAQHAPSSSELPGRAFELKHAFGFATLVTGVMFVSAFLADRYGSMGASIGITVAGFVDAHSTAASAATLAAHGSMSSSGAIYTILLAVSANTVTKMVVALFECGVVFSSRVAVGLILMLSALWTTVYFTLDSAFALA